MSKIMESGVLPYEEYIQFVRNPQLLENRATNLNTIATDLIKINR